MRSSESNNPERQETVSKAGQHGSRTQTGLPPQKKDKNWLQQRLEEPFISLKSVLSEYKQMPMRVWGHIKKFENMIFAAGMTSLFLTAIWTIPTFLSSTPISFGTEGVTLLAISTSSLILGALSTLFFDAISQTVLQRSPGKFFLRAPLMALVGGVLSGLGTDNAIRLAHGISQIKNLPPIGHFAYLFLFVQMIWMPVWSLSFSYFRDKLIEKRVNALDPQIRETQKRNLIIGAWKTWYFSFPFDTIAFVAMLAFAPQWSYPIILAASFLNYYTRTIGVEQRWDNHIKTPFDTMLAEHLSRPPAPGQREVLENNDESVVFAGGRFHLKRV